MKAFPALVHQDFSVEGRGYLEAAVDVKLSSAGENIREPVGEEFSRVFQKIRVMKAPSGVG